MCKEKLCLGAISRGGLWVCLSLAELPPVWMLAPHTSGLCNFLPPQTWREPEIMFPGLPRPEVKCGLVHIGLGVCQCLRNQTGHGWSWSWWSLGGGFEEKVKTGSEKSYRVGVPRSPLTVPLLDVPLSSFCLASYDMGSPSFLLWNECTFTSFLRGRESHSQVMGPSLPEPHV